MSRFKESRFWRLTLLFTVFALVVVACGGSDTADEEVAEEAPAETAAPATTAAAAEEAAPSGPDGVFKMAVFSDPATQNFWNYLDTETDVWTGWAMTGQSTSLYSVSMPNYQLVTNMAAELVEASTDNGDGTWSYTVPITEGYMWSDGTPVTANDWVFTYNTVKALELQNNWMNSWPMGSGEGDEKVQGVVGVVADNDY